MIRLRAFGIVAVFLTVTVVLLPLQWLAIRLRFPLRRTLPHRYHRFVCLLFGIRIAVLGQPAQGGVLMIANHSSWLDIAILSAVWPVSFVAKSEVNRWPFFGTLARMQRSVFVRRERAQTLANREKIRRRLLEGDALVIFPEGTSSDGNRVLPFRSALLSTAEFAAGSTAGDRLAAVPVQPVSIAYTALYGIPMGRENRPLFAWYGDMEMVPHLWEAILAGPIEVVVQFHTPLSLDEMDRKTLAVRARQVIQAGVSEALQGRTQLDLVPAGAR